jgi:hypothetical protein
MTVEPVVPWSMASKCLGIDQVQATARDLTV